MQHIFEKFMERYQAERNPAQNTARIIRSTIPRFLEFCQGRGRQDVNEITREDVIDYLNSLNGTRTSTKKLRKTIIMIFLDRCFSHGFLKQRMERVNFKGPVDVPRAPLKGFTAEEMATMGQNIRRLGFKERIIFHLLSTRPLRISELAKLKTGDVNLKEKTFTIYRSKNTKTRVVSLPRETIADLEELIRPDLPKEQSLFGLSLWSMERRILEMIKMLRVAPNGRGAHAFRHTVIMNMLRKAKADPAVVAQIAGNTPKTIYSNYAGQVSIDEQRRAEKASDRTKGW